MTLAHLQKFYAKPKALLRDRQRPNAFACRRETRHTKGDLKKKAEEAKAESRQQ